MTYFPTAPVLALHTASFMTSAVTLYERLGFRRVPRYDFDAGPHFGAVDVPTVRALAYRLELTRSHGEPVARDHAG